MFMEFFTLSYCKGKFYRLWGAGASSGGGRRGGSKEKYWLENSRSDRTFWLPRAAAFNLSRTSPSSSALYYTPCSSLVPPSRPPTFWTLKSVSQPRTGARWKEGRGGLTRRVLPRFIMNFRRRGYSWWVSQDSLLLKLAVIQAIRKIERNPELSGRR